MAAHLVLKFSTYPMGLISVHHGTVSPQYSTQLSNTDNGCMHATAPVSRCACDNRESVCVEYGYVRSPTVFCDALGRSAGFPYGTLSWQSALSTGHCMPDRWRPVAHPNRAACCPGWAALGRLLPIRACIYGFRCNYTLSLRLDKSNLSHTTLLNYSAIFLGKSFFNIQKII